jgi:hypothetical protein
LKIVVHADGWITKETEGFDYAKRAPRKDRVHFLQALSYNDVDIIVETKRMERDRKVTEQWMKKFNIPYKNLALLGPFGVKSKHVHDDQNLARWSCNGQKFAIKTDIALNSTLRAIIGTISSACLVKDNEATLDIQVEGPVSYDLAEFLSFLLSDDKVDKHIEVHLSGDDSLNNETGDAYFDKTICLSGGADSWVAQQLTGAFPLFVHYGECYNDMEWNFVQKMGAVRFDVALPKRHPSWQYVIPARNFLLVAMAAMFGNEVIMAAVKGDRSPDKGDYFFKTASRILTESYGRPIAVTTPFANTTKTQLIAKYLSLGKSKRHLQRTVSCYSPVGMKHCGQCKACVRRAIAFKLNHVHRKSDYVANPLTCEVALKMRDDALAGIYDDERATEILKVIK